VLLPLRVEVFALIAKAMPTSAAHLVIRLDVVSHSAFVVVVVDACLQLEWNAGTCGMTCPPYRKSLDKPMEHSDSSHQIFLTLA
jgi:hypothetical protein